MMFTTQRLVISFLRFMGRPAGLVGSQNCAKLAGRVGSGHKIWTRVQLWVGRLVQFSYVAASCIYLIH